MTVEVSGYAAAQARVSQLRAMFGDGSGAATTAREGAAGGAAFNASMQNALATLNAAPATAERPFIYDPSAGTGSTQLKSGADDVLTALERTPGSSAPNALRVADTIDGSSSVASATGSSRAVGAVGAAGVSGLSGLGGIAGLGGIDGTKADAVIATAKKYRGVPYKWGGTDPRVGLDCSGFVQLVYKQHGIKLPRVSQDQQKVGTRVDGIENARPGDLVTFGNPATHIGIYVGDGKMIHAPRTGDVVKIAPLNKNLSSIRRVLPDDAWTPAVTRGDAGGVQGVGVPASFTNALVTSGVDGPTLGAVLAGIHGPSRTATEASSAATGAGIAARNIASTSGATLSQAPGAYQKLFVAAEQKYGVPANVLAAVARQESNFNPRAVSHAGARGLMQLMPGTARSLGVTNSFDPAQAVDGAARLLRDHLRTFGSLDLALAAYNAGPGAVRKYNGVPPYAETRNYVATITRNLGARAA